MNFTHLFVETNYSMNGSNITIKKMIEKAKEFGFSSLSMTDNRMYGIIQFYKECKKNDIKPILGLQVIVEGVNSDSRNSVLLYATNNTGYHNLLKIASVSAVNGYLKLSEMKAYGNGVLAVYQTDGSELFNYFSSNMKKEFIEVINMLNDTFKEYLVSVSASEELNDYFENKMKLVYTDKVEYFEHNDKEIFSTLKKIFNKTVDDLFDQEKQSHFREFDISSYKYKNALDNVSFIIEKCNVDLSFDKTHLPKYPTKNNISSRDYLKALVLKGLDKRLENRDVDRNLYNKRVQYELDVINSMGYNDYFLIVWDFVKYAKQKKYLVGPGRGSAAASLVSYCLGITSVDSLEYDLVFERFLNPERITLPDIDMDLPDDKRDDIIKYVNELYGKDKVASICTFGTFQKKSAIRDSARALNIDGIVIDEIIKRTDNHDTIASMMTDSEEIINIISQNEQAKELLNVASRVEGLIKHVSTHAAGIIVGEKKLVEHTALQNGLLDMYQTQYEAKDLESLGLLKIDFLGLRNLTSIDKVVRMINEKEGTNIDIYKVPLDDKKTFELLKKVDVTGVFQLESQGMRSLIGQMQMKEFEDIVTVLALFRPGPMENIPSYIKRRFKDEEVTFPHPILKEVLGPTNGIIIYQEQIIKIASLFAGYSLGEADVLRRAVSKKQGDVLEKERKNFVTKARNKGHKDEVSNEIYNYIVKFANYGFNRAHSVAYAMVSYWMAYLKANYPKYFISVLTSSVIGSESQMRNYIFEANKLGVQILKPSVNTSELIFIPEENDLRYPLLGIKNVGINSVNQLLEERKASGEFKSFIDFVSRVEGKLNRRVIESLIKAGACDIFKLNKRTMIEKLEEVLNFSTFGTFISKEEFLIENIEEYSYQTLEDMEKSVLGFNLTMNPLMEYQDYIDKHQLLKPSDITLEHVGKELRIIGLLSSIRRIKTKTNKNMAFISVQDEYNKLDAVLFSTLYQENENSIFKNKVYLFMVKVEERNGNVQLIVNKLHKMGE